MPAIEKETKKPELAYNEIRLEKKDKGQPEPKVEIGIYPFNNIYLFISNIMMRYMKVIYNFYKY